MFVGSMSGASRAFVTFTDWTRAKGKRVGWTWGGGSGEPGNVVPSWGRRRTSYLSWSWAAAVVLQDCLHRGLGGVADDFDVSHAEVTWACLLPFR